MARPTVMTKDVLQKLEEAFIMGCSDEEACLLAEIGTATLSDYCRNHESFRSKKELLKQSPNLKARKEVVEGIKGNPEFALKYLERKKKDEFSPRTDLKHENDKENPIQPITVVYTTAKDRTDSIVEGILKDK